MNLVINPMTMKPEDITRAIDIVRDVQETSAPITIQIGSVSKSDQVQHDTLIIKHAPASLTKRLVNAGYSLFIGENGVSVDYFKTTS